MTSVILLLLIVIILLLAVYWTLWKMRGELGQCQDKLMSELSETRKSPEQKAEKA